MNEKYYRRQISGLLKIMQDANGMIAREYVIEKLRMILVGGINFHPVIAEALDEEEKQNGQR